MNISNGWLPIANTFAKLVAWDVIHNEMPEVSITGVYENSSFLRIYYTGGNDITDAYARFAEQLSEKICEECGRPAVSKSGWPVRCEEHL